MGADFPVGARVRVGDRLGRVIPQRRFVNVRLDGIDAPAEFPAEAVHLVPEEAGMDYVGWTKTVSDRNGHQDTAPSSVCCLRPEGHLGRHTNKVGRSSTEQPAVDTDLRDQTVRAIASQQAVIPDEDDGFEWERIRGDADAVMSEVAPVLAERDQLRKQVQLLGNALQRTAYTDKDVAERDAEIQRLKERIALHDEYAEELRRRISRDGRVVDGLRGERITLWEERDKAATALAAIADRNRWEFPPSLGDRIQLVASEVHVARENINRLRVQLDELQADKQAWQGHECEAGCSREHVPPDGSPFGSVTPRVGSQPDSEPRGGQA